MGYENEYFGRQSQSIDARVVAILAVDVDDNVIEPITLQEAKDYLRITNNQDDNLITNQITQARQMAETYLSKDILSRSRELYIGYVVNEFELIGTPLLTTVDVAVEIESAEATFTLFGFEEPVVRLDSRPARDVKVTYSTKGLGTEVKQGVLAAVAYLYYGRTDKVNTNYKEFLAPYKKLYI